MISHGTRAFIVNAEGLPGFIIKFDLKQVLIQADVSGELSSLQEHQHVSISEIEREFSDNNLSSLDDKMDYLSQCYPGLYIHLLGPQYLNDAKTVKSFMETCKHSGGAEGYTLYLQGYYLPLLRQQLAGTKTIATKEKVEKKVYLSVKNDSWNGNKEIIEMQEKTLHGRGTAYEG